MATISSPIGRTPRNAGAGANTYKKGGMIKTKKVSDSRGPSKDGYAPSVQKKGGTVKKVTPIKKKK